jgi:hypothetical protein
VPNLLVPKSLPVVSGEQLDELVGALAKLLLRPARDFAMLSGALELRERVVGDVSDENVAEGILVRLGQARRLARNDELLDT